jgi:hypothetical protein
MINHPNRRKPKNKPTTASAQVGPAASAVEALAPEVRSRHEHDYSGLLAGVRASFDTAIYDSDSPLFTTDARFLWEEYLTHLAPGQAQLRQVHNCHCCRRFVETYGGLVAITPQGQTRPVMWNIAAAPSFYRDAFAMLWAKVKEARVTGVFKTKEAVWGTRETGEWRHMHVVAPAVLVHRSRALTPFQAMAAAKENVETVRRAMVDYPPAVLDEALRLFEAGVLDRSEKFIGPVRWLRKLHDWPKGRQNQHIRNNILMRAVALAPEGYCHIKSSVVGPLLDDIQNRVPFEEIKRKHGEKTRSDVYQRPQELPSEGNVRAAEALFDKMGLAPALKRRFAMLEDLELNWVSAGATVDRSRPSGVFNGVPVRPGRSAVTAPSVDIPPITMTWSKFSEKVLPNALRIDASINHTDGFFALTAAEDQNAPPLLKWDDDAERNTVGWYTYLTGSSASQWKLKPGWVQVNAVTPTPNLWGSRPQPQHGRGAFLVLDGAVDIANRALALFAEHLRQDVYPVRGSIEQFSKMGKLSGADKATACGLMIRDEAGAVRSRPRLLRAYDGRAWTSHLIDRWD